MTERIRMITIYFLAPMSVYLLVLIAGISFYGRAAFGPTIVLAVAAAFTVRFFLILRYR